MLSKSFKFLISLAPFYFALSLSDVQCLLRKIYIVCTCIRSKKSFRGATFRSEISRSSCFECLIRLSHVAETSAETLANLLRAEPNNSPVF